MTDEHTHMVTHDGPALPVCDLEALRRSMDAVELNAAARLLRGRLQHLEYTLRHRTSAYHRAAADMLATARALEAAAESMTETTELND